jgi:hypothetical protein
MKKTPSRASATRRDIWATVLAATVGLALVGCGGGGGAQSSATHSTSSASTSASTSTGTGETTASSTGGAQPGGTTAPGTNLTPGTSALVDYKPGVSDNSPTYRLQVAVVSMQKGSKAELAGVELEKPQQGLTPYYVKLRIRNEGSGNASAEDGVPSAGFQAIDDRGQQGQELTVLGNFRSCESGTQPKQFTRGVTYQTCEIFLVGSGGSIVKEEWTGSGDAYAEKPIVWKAG